MCFASAPSSARTRSHRSPENPNARNPTPLPTRPPGCDNATDSLARTRAACSSVRDAVSSKGFPVILARAFDNDALERAQPQPATLTRRPRLRQLVPDSKLLRRRASGEPLRTLASDYAVAHTTLARFFAQPEITDQLRQTSQQLRAEQRARTVRRRPAKRQDH